jgi:pilus assembly protein FimV
MKRPLLLPLAIALALSGSHAFALGLGTIQVKSKLNQPLDAEIPILQGTAGEAEGLLVQMAAAEDFDRVGLNRSRLSVPLEFTIVKGSRGDAVIKVTSKEIIREPFLDFLVEANWPKGRLLREYTVLLDPPVMAPATGSAVTAVPKALERAPTQVVPESKPKPAPPPKSAPVAVAPAPSRPVETPSRPAAAPKRAVSGNEVTVEEGDTLSGIARSVRPDEATNINQLMLAMLKQNPNAFFKNNINTLKRGAILRIPSADEAKAVGSASEAAAQVHAQIEDWRGGAAAKPTLVADTGTQPEPKTPAATAKPTSTSTTPTAAAKPKTDSLELVPPKAGKDTIAMADRPGSGGSNTANELRSELSRTKETLTSREQESSELKSRVKELEETKNKSDRMITLQKSEIADLQNKLAQLQADSKNAPKTGTTTAATTTPPPTTPAASTSPPTATTATPPPTSGTPTSSADKLSKEDIWGNATATPDTKTPSTTASTTTTPSATTPSAPATTTASTTPPVSSSTPSLSTSAAPSTSTTTAGSSGLAPFTPSPSIAPTVPGDASSTAATTPAASTPPSKPVSTTAPVKPESKTKVQPLTTTAPVWYQQSWVKPAAIGAGALLVLAALLGMRKRKPALATERGSIAGAFGDSPLSPSGDSAMDVASLDSEEQVLRDQLVHEPANIGLHLELLSVLYSERDVVAFEDAAETMHIYVVDEHQPEWLEARAMGQELAPHNPLFADEDAAPRAFDEAVTAPHATTPAYERDDVEDVFGMRETVARAAPDPVDTTFDFDLDLDRDRETRAPLAPGAPVEPTFGFDNLPPIDFNNEALRAAEEAAAVPPLHVDEDEFPGEDGVGTKLDLAKAYLDMGDPEGARSMLEEVLAEGNDVQKGEARRLMAEIR